MNENNRGGLVALVFGLALTIGTPVYAQESRPAKAETRENTGEDVVRHLMEWSRAQLEERFHDDFYRGFHSTIKDGKTVLNPVQNDDATRLLGYGREILDGTYDHIEKVVERLHEMKLGRTIVPWAGKTWNLTREDHVRPYERAITVLEGVKKCKAEHVARQKLDRTELKRLITTYDDAPPSTRADIEAMISTLQDRINEPYVPDKKKLEKAVGFFTTEIERRVCSYPDAPEGGVSVLFEPVSTAWPRAKMREIAAEGKKRPVVIVQQTELKEFVFRMYDGSNTVRVYSARKE